MGRTKRFVIVSALSRIEIVHLFQFLSSCFVLVRSMWIWWRSLLHCSDVPYQSYHCIFDRFLCLFWASLVFLILGQDRRWLIEEVAVGLKQIQCKVVYFDSVEGFKHWALIWRKGRRILGALTKCCWTLKNMPLIQIYILTLASMTDVFLAVVVESGGSRSLRDSYSPCSGIMALFDFYWPNIITTPERDRASQLVQLLHL